MIRSSHHPLKEANLGKKSILALFIKEMNRVQKEMILYIWEKGITWKTSTGTKICCPSEGHFDTPSYFDYKQIPIATNLSARALSSLTSQVCGIVKSATKKHTKRLYVLSTLKNEEEIFRLKKKIVENPPKIPEVEEDSAIELSSKCALFIQSNGRFGGFLRLQSLGKEYGKIYLPIKLHKHSHKLQGKGILKGSFLIALDQVDLRWEITVEKKKEGKIVGVDTGKRNPVTLSSNPKIQDHPHKHTMTGIIKNLSRKKRGSKGFERVKRHLDNYTRWYINQLNFSGIKQLNLEKVRYIKKGRRLPRNLTHWSNPVIEKAISNKCELEGVLLNLQDSTYRSQRCSCCGLVRKSNRKGAEYNCLGCGFKCDSDLNAAKNHELQLISLPGDFRRLKKNLGRGFYWLSSQIILLDDSEHRIPDTPKRKTSRNTFLLFP